MPTVRVLDHSDHDRVQAVSRLRTYAFHPETAAGGVPPDDTAGVTFITDTEGEVSAAASLLDLTTNVRGRVLSTAGVAAVDSTRPRT
ncbi:MAG TPA: hypothetical protein VNV66_05875, partial [Pilimelia sp.]|nr:hypothetical protein [Pilimelia sp.]